MKSPNQRSYRRTIETWPLLAVTAASIAFATPSASAGILVAVANTILDYNTNGTPNGTYVTLPAGYSATGMVESGGNLYIAANNGPTGRIYKYEPGTSTLTIFDTPGVGTPIQQIDFASDGKLYFAVQGAGIYSTTGGGATLLQSNVQNTIGLTASGDGNFVVWGYAGPQDAASLDGYGDISASPGPPFNLLGPTGAAGLGGTGNYYTPTALAATAGGFTAGVYAGSGKTFVKTGVNYANAGSTLWEFGGDGDSNNQINGLTVDPSGNLYVCVSTQGNPTEIYSFVGQAGSPTLISSVAGAGNILYFNTAPATAGYSGWAVSKSLNPLTNGAPGFDKDDDGSSNLEEYAFFTEPTSGSSIPVTTVSGGGSEVSLTYLRATQATDVTYTAESSTDLLLWSPTGVTDAPTGVSDTNTVQYRAAVAKGSASAKFLRVKVSLPTPAP